MKIKRTKDTEEKGSDEIGKKGGRERDRKEGMKGVGEKKGEDR